jgi:hypothetical protein
MPTLDEDSSSRLSDLADTSIASLMLAIGITTSTVVTLVE